MSTQKVKSTILNSHTDSIIELSIFKNSVFQHFSLRAFVLCSFKNSCRSKANTYVI